MNNTKIETLFTNVMEFVHEFPKTFIIVFKSVQTKKVYLTMGSSVLDVLKRFVCVWEHVLGDGVTVDVYPYEHFDIQHLQINMYIHMVRLQSEGYEFVVRPKCVNYRVKMELVNSVTYVYLVCGRGDAFVVGLFETSEEAYQFVTSCYNRKVNLYNIPVYAFNKLSSDYFIEREKSTIRFRL